MRAICILVYLLCHISPLFSQATVTRLRVENQDNPIGLDIPVPRFSWQIRSENRNTTQTHYEIRVSMDEGFKKVIWTTGKNMSTLSHYVPYGGPELASGQTYYWQVRVWDGSEMVSAWSPTAHWHTGFFKSTDWKANWISAPTREGAASPYFRKSFDLGKKIKSALVFASAHGLYELYLNGKKVGNDYFTPGWTAYQKRIQYQCYDVTESVKSGTNALGAVLGNGWYLGELGWENHRYIYGKDLAFIAQLIVTYTDGSTETITTDGTWKVSYGVIRFSEIYDGEKSDLRLETRNWNQPEYDDKFWKTTIVQDFPKDLLVGTYNEPVRAHEKINPKSVITTPKGEVVLDFGQNMTGWVQVRADGKTGDRIILRYAEILEPTTGNVYFKNLRKATSADTFYLAGTGNEWCIPHFTFHGFRYVSVEGMNNTLSPDRFTAVALYSDMTPTGQFECAHPLVNQLQHNIQWGQRGNFLDIPTDCPQRDERLGWTGDAQVFTNTALFNFDAHNFFVKWLKDLSADQMNDGKVPYVVPNVLGETAGGSAGWADAATIIPWNTYVATGDQRILEEQYESMKAWVGFMEKNSKNYLWDTGFHFGDWLFYDVDDDREGRSAITDKYYIAQCFFIHSIQNTIKAAQVLGKKNDIERLNILLKNVKSAFLNEYITPNGRPVSSSQTAYVLALQFDLLPENQRATAAKALVDNIRNYGTHLTTGFIGTPYLCHVLSRFGYDDIAYELLFQETYPSWLYPVKMGATTIWERWDGIKPDSTLQNPGMNSFNHYAYGAIGDWMYRRVAGINPVADQPGYKMVKIAPVPNEALGHASATFEGPYGTIQSAWKIINDSIHLDITLPPNTTAVVEIPTYEPKSARLDATPLVFARELPSPPDLSNRNFAKVQIGSGKWHFVAKSPVILQPPALKEYAGKYRTGGWAGRSEVRIRAGQLQLMSNSGISMLKETIVKDTFSGADGIQLHFTRDSKGQINGIELTSAAGVTVKGRKG